MTMADLALQERACDATQRIPTARWPLFSTTLTTTIPVGATQPAVQPVFEAERDTTFTDLTIEVVDSVTGAVVPARVDIEYCNVDYADGTDVEEFAACCSRKPIFLVGVRENKRIRFVITTDAAVAVNPANVGISLSGFQGKGCCP